jgi:hypothetical protein
MSWLAKRRRNAGACVKKKTCGPKLAERWQQTRHSGSRSQACAVEQRARASRQTGSRLGSRGLPAHMSEGRADSKPTVPARVRWRSPAIAKGLRRNCGTGLCTPVTLRSKDDSGRGFNQQSSWHLSRGKQRICTCSQARQTAQARLEQIASCKDGRDRGKREDLQLELWTGASYSLNGFELSARCTLHGNNNWHCWHCTQQCQTHV